MILTAIPYPWKYNSQELTFHLTFKNPGSSFSIKDLSSDLLSMSFFPSDIAYLSKTLINMAMAISSWVEFAIAWSIGCCRIEGQQG